MKTINLLGIGNNTSVFIDLAMDCGYDIAGLYHYNDSRTGEYINGYKILGSYDDLLEMEDLTHNNFLMTMGDNKIRLNLAEKIRSRGGVTPRVIHPTAVISRFSEIAEGVTISAFSYVQANTFIGKDTLILSGVNVSHDNRIGKACFLAGGVTIGAFTTLEDFVFVGQGVITISKKVERIGENAFIAAGALVTNSVDSNRLVIGAPARAKACRNQDNE